MMFKALLIFVICCAVALVWSTPRTVQQYDLELANQHFEDFEKAYQRKYQNEEERQMRFKIFKENLIMINQRNLRSKTATFGINRFTDMTKEEVLRKYTGLSQSESVLQPKFCAVAPNATRDPVPEAFDWRDHKKVTRVKNQGSCGSCWAFSVIGNLEGQYAIKYNKLIEFSEQQLVDCDKYDLGCYGGWMTHAFRFIIRYMGLESDQDYPYSAIMGDCQYNENKTVATVANCYVYKVANEDELKKILVSTGPLSIGVDAFDFASYKSGIIDNCHFQEINHGVLLVGYGKENNTPYWIIKNSWSDQFGEKGYVRVKMYENCGGLLDIISSATLK